MIDPTRDRCFLLQEEAEAANQAGRYIHAASLFHEAAAWALTEEGRIVLVEKAKAAEARARRDE